MSMALQIDVVFRQLNGQLKVSDPRARRDAAQACCQELESLKMAATSQDLSVLVAACDRARCTFDVLHQELQYSLEWAGSAMID